MENPVDGDKNEQGFERAPGDYPPRVVVQLCEGALNVPYNDAAHNYLMDLGGEEWRRVLKEHGLRVRAPFSPENAEGIQKLAERARRHAEEKGRKYEPPNLLTYFYLENPEGVESKESLQQAVEQLTKLQFVERAYVDRLGPDPSVNASAEPRFLNQTHLGVAPDGIDARYAWKQPGGNGAGVNFIDLEAGWTLDHEDLVRRNSQVLYGTIKNKSREHGTAVLGIVCAELNALGGVGVAPGVGSAQVVSHFVPGIALADSRHDALVEAFKWLDTGDILLVEAQVEISRPGPDIYGPVDVTPFDFDVISLGCQAGVVVVEAGGNGTRNGEEPPLDLDSLNLQDSGAIIVSAATSAAPHYRLPYAPYGQRVDCYAWGENIDTCLSDSNGVRDLYRPRGATVGFGGTSGAAAIIAGALIVLQGIARARGLHYDGLEWRAILRKTQLGTSPASDEPAAIGAMPDLCKIIASLPLAPAAVGRPFPPWRARGWRRSLAAQRRPFPSRQARGRR